jgi:hypothetical protein
MVTARDVEWVQRQLLDPKNHHRDVTFPLKWGPLHKFTVLASEALSIASDKSACAMIYDQMMRIFDYNERRGTNDLWEAR